ncbi:hypothetical protein [Actinomadura rugatobispora]|uniref:Cytochrome P450 n=1 Tax=Actinomadura rugatobispora TaxID=1994 RepID=A0ABW1AKD6_9ACTN|nr:hypothetical protein GCM10010200_046440 [Actinomadura rugatobispora]
MTADARSDASPAALAVEELREQFPGVPLWFGLHTRMFWALVRVADSPRLVEAITPQELATAIKAPWWPWPSQ